MIYKPGGAFGKVAASGKGQSLDLAAQSVPFAGRPNPENQ
jgi:hypothetical protein